jgi:nicotinamide riboside kinase
MSFVGKNFFMKVIILAGRKVTGISELNKFLRVNFNKTTVSTKKARALG